MPACPVGPVDRTGMVIFFACLDRERKSSLINRLISHKILGLNYRTERLDWQENFKGITWGNKKNVINSIKFAISELLTCMHNFNMI